MAEREPLWEQIALGRVWCGYEIFEELGRGGMGVVYRAKLEKDDRIVAFKVMLGGSESQGRRFLREAQATAKLDHPNIVKIYAMGNERGCCYFTMDYIAGTTFEKFIARDAPLEEKIDVVIKIAGALQHAHQNKVVHRDVKPSNILLDEFHEPYLSDFGLAKMLDRNTQLTDTGQVLGTPFYMSPEQIQGSKKIAATSDIYSLGVVLYQALTGKLPFTAGTVGSLYYKIAVEDPLPPHVHKPGMASALDAICLKALEKLPALRYESALALAEDLLRFRRGQKVRASAVSIRGRRLLRKVIHQRFWIAPAAALLSLIIVWFCLRTGRPEPTLPVARILAGAHDAVNSRDYRLAMDRLDQILTADPGHKQALLLRADVLQTQGQWEQMRICWARLSELELSCGELTRIGATALAAGYLQDARTYLEKAAAGSAEGRKLLAETLFYLGQYRESKQNYIQLPETDPEVVLGLAAIYSNEQKYEKAELLLQIPGQSLPPHLIARASLLKAKLLWERRVDDLNHWEWLFQRTEHKVRYDQVRSALREIGENLRGAAELLNEPGGNYPYRRLKSEVELYGKAIALETETSAEQSASALQEFRALAIQMPLAMPARIFLHTVAIRCLIRNTLWEEAYRECSQAIEIYPWVDNFYHFRGIATFHISPESLSCALDDIYQAVGFKPWDFLPMENFLFLLSENPTQRENDLFWQICATYVEKLELPEYAMRGYMAALREEYWASVPQRETHGGNTPWEELIDVAMHNSSPGARDMAIAMLGSQYENEQLRQRIGQLQEHENSPKIKKCLERLDRALDQERINAALYRLKGILLEKSSRIDPKQAMKIREMGDGERLCREILENAAEAPLMRFLAARAMISLATLSAYDNLLAIAKEGSYPARFLAAVALREKGICIDVSDVLERSYSHARQDGHFLRNQPPLYRMLFTFYVDPDRYPEVMERLLRDPDEMVALCAAHNCRRYLKVCAPLQDLLTSRFLELIRSQDSRVRAVAIRFFWCFDGIDHSAGWELYQKYWRDYGYTLIEVLQREKDGETLFCALQSIIFSTYFPHYIVEPEAQQNPVILELEQLLAQRVRSPNSGHFDMVWTAFALGGLYSQEIVTVLGNASCNFFIRFATLNGFLNGARGEGREKWSNLLSKLLPILEQQAQQRCNTSDDRRAKNVALLFLSQAGVLFSVPVAKIAIHDLTSADSRIRATAVATLMWAGGHRDISRLYPFLKDEDVNVQRAAATTIAALIHRYKPDEAENFHEIISACPERIRRAAAYGYYEHVLQGVYSSGVLCQLNRILWSGRLLWKYDRYAEELRKMAKPEWSTEMDQVLGFWPDSRYLYESALIACKFRRFSDARRHIDLAFQYLEDKPPLEQESLDKECLLLRSEILAMANDYHHANACMEQLAQKYPLDQKLHARLSDFYRDLHRERESRQHLWLSYLSDPMATYNYLADNTLNGNPQEAGRWLIAIHERFPLNYRSLMAVCPMLCNNPWVKFLPP